MKKIIAIALATLLTAPLECITHTNKTFFKPRPQNYYLPLETTTWHRAMTNNVSGRYRLGLQATGYYRISTSKSELGAYFGASGSNTIIFDIATKEEDVDSRAIIHRAVPIDEPENATDLRAILTLKPEHEAYGANFTMHHDLSPVVHGLYLALEVPLTNVCHNLNARLEKDCSQKDSLLNVSALDYLRGNVTQPEGINEQAALTHAKICGRLCKTDIADINLKLGWLLADHCQCRAGLYGFVTIPTTPKTCGKFLFEPALGTCGHWAAGVGLNTHLNIYQGMRSAFEVTTHLLYRYLFKDHEVRTLGFKLDNKTTLPWSHYLLGGRIGQTGVFPLANVLTREVNVTPGMNAEAMINFSFHTGACTFDFGYDFYARECDKIQLPACPTLCDTNCCDTGFGWPDNTYALANFSYNTVDEFGIGFGETPVNDEFTMNIDGPINREHLDLQTCAVPASLTHTLYLAVGCTLNEDRMPVVLGIGAAYEIVNNNAALENAMFWGKFGILF